MRRTFLILALVVVIGVLIFGPYAFFNDRGRLTTAPEFTGLAGEVSGRTIQYPADPAVLISFAEEFSYIGGQKFVLYGTANVEQHFFVATKANDDLESIFWIQFEGVRPGFDWQYDYSSSPLRTQIGEFDFYTDTEPGVRSPVFEYGEPGTDGYLARKFAANKGFRIPKDFAYARLVHLPTEDRRKELLIIFMDDLAPTGFSGRELQPGGSHEDEWPEISRAHLEKIQRLMCLSRPD